MCENTQYESVCKDEFSQLNSKLDQLDTAIRGNGKVGLATRVDRLEQEKLFRSKIMWFVLGSLGTALASTVISLFVG